MSRRSLRGDPPLLDQRASDPRGRRRAVHLHRIRVCDVEDAARERAEQVAHRLPAIARVDARPICFVANRDAGLVDLCSRVHQPFGLAQAALADRRRNAPTTPEATRKMKPPSHYAKQLRQKAA